MFSSDTKVNFDLGGMLLENVNDSFVYSRVKFRIVQRMLDVSIDHTLRKFNAAAFNIIINSKDLTGVECKVRVNC